MKIEKNKYVKLNEFCIIGFINISCDSSEDYNYIVALRSHNYLEEDEYEIYGFGTSFEACLLKSLDILSQRASQTISFETLNDLSIREFINHILEERFSFPPSKILLPSEPKDDQGYDWSPYLKIDGDKAYLFLT